MAKTIAREIAERVVRPVYTEKGEPAVGLYLGEQCRFVLPAAFVFGQGASMGRDHLLEELRKVVEEAAQDAVNWERHLDGVRKAPRGQEQPLDAVGLRVDTNDYYRGKYSR